MSPEIESQRKVLPASSLSHGRAADVAAQLPPLVVDDSLLPLRDAVHRERVFQAWMPAPGVSAVHSSQTFSSAGRLTDALYKAAMRSLFAFCSA